MIAVSGIFQDGQQFLAAQADHAAKKVEHGGQSSFLRVTNRARPEQQHRVAQPGSRNS